MVMSWDADGHVEESEETFSDKYFDAEFQDRKPVVVESPDSFNGLGWDIPSRGYYKLGGSPVSRGGGPTSERPDLPEWRRNVASAELRSAEARIQVLDQEHLAMQVNYPTMLLSCPVAYDPALNAAILRSYNNWIADISGQASDRLKWVTLIDPADPREAAREIQRTKEMGSVGVMVFGQYGDLHLDDPSLEPIWATAVETGLPIAVHPGTVLTTLDSDFHFSVLIGFKHILLSGILDRHPTLKFSFLETGSTWVDFMVWRVEEFIEAMAGRSQLRGDIRHLKLPELRPEEYIQRGQLFFGFEPEEPMLAYMVERWGPDCLLYASDIPHTHRMVDSTSFLLQREDLSQETKRKILVDNTAVFYGL